MLISLHMPKTAGTSFAKSLEEHYGRGYLRDYGDLPINTSPLLRKTRAVFHCFVNAVRRFEGVECIHGHFLPLKYLLLGARRRTWFVTWMRHPMERIVSQYYHWQRTYDAETSPPLHRRVIVEQWSLERFCLSPELRNTCSQFLWGFPLHRFDFVGITEHFEEDFAFFERKFLGSAAAPYRVNINPERERDDYLDDSTLRERVEAYHQVDMAIYRQALRLRSGRCQD